CEKGRPDTKKPANLSRFGNPQRLKHESCKSQQICKRSENSVSRKTSHTQHQPPISGAKTNTSTSTPHHHTLATPPTQNRRSLRHTTPSLI
ncbi:hypothetical protein L195_g057055, partial [Trifolium pratense]